jgi:hypothetical protein
MNNSSARASSRQTRALPDVCVEMNSTVVKEWRREENVRRVPAGIPSWGQTPLSQASGRCRARNPHYC